jgi:hypothetical protein
MAAAAAATARSFHSTNLRQTAYSCCLFLTTLIIADRQVGR